MNSPVYRVCGLVSGGKDSTLCLLKAIFEGHTLVALANLHPPAHGSSTSASCYVSGSPWQKSSATDDMGEIDSYMYQSVAHEGIEMYAAAMGLPLYRRPITGICKNSDLVYVNSSISNSSCKSERHDEVEDLFELLTFVLSHEKFDAVAVGAILSDYQRTRVENVCARLGLKVLSFLWRQPQTQLLQEMIDCELDAIIVKVASFGLSADRFLGRSIRDARDDLLLAGERCALNVCGEGGEYESFVLDCPLFRRRLVLEAARRVTHQEDAIAPVVYLRFERLRLEDKPADRLFVPLDARELSLTAAPELARLIPRVVSSHRTEFDLCDIGPQLEPLLFSQPLSPLQLSDTLPPDALHLRVSPDSRGEDTTPAPLDFHFVVSEWHNRFFFYANAHDTASAARTPPADTLRSALEQLRDELQRRSLDLSRVLSVQLYLSDMNQFAAVNAAYSTFFSLNPPVRSCVQFLCCGQQRPPSQPLAVTGLESHVREASWSDSGAGGDSPSPSPLSCCSSVSPTCSPRPNPEDRANRGARSLCWSLCASGLLASPSGRRSRSAAQCSSRAMHVQSLSHWAPANIGPYSQSQLVSECSLSPAADSDADSDADVDEDSNETARWERLYVSGQIGMVPANLCLITSASGTGRAPTMAALAIECRLALRHLRRVMQASRGFEDAHLCHVLFYVTRAELVPIARLELEHMFALDSRLPTRPVSGGVCTGSERTSNALVQWALVPALPKGAHFEVEAHAVRYDAGAALTDATHRVLFGFETHAIHSRTSEFTAELYTCAVADRLLVARLSVLTPTATQPQGIDSETIAAAISEALLLLLRSCAGADARAASERRALVGRLFYEARAPALFELVERLGRAGTRLQLALVPVPVAQHELEPRLLFTLLIVT